MAKLETRRELFLASRTPGLMLVKTTPGRKSRVHATDCRALRMLVDGMFSGTLSGTALECHHCGDWAEAAELWRSEVGGEPRPCSRCRPAPVPTLNTADPHPAA